MKRPRDSGWAQLSLPRIPETYLGGPPLALCAPVIKYVGAKRWAVPHLAPRIHAVLCASLLEGTDLTGATYVEPFCGGLAMGLAVGWPRSIYADVSPDVANLYASVVVDPEAVGDALDALCERHPYAPFEERVVRGKREVVDWRVEQFYYEIRREIWPDRRGALSQFEWAARMIYLNRNSFNGLLRVNQRRGEFNVPWGKRAVVNMPPREHLRKVAETLRPAEIRHCDFGDVMRIAAARALAGEAVVAFIDPPYAAPMEDVTSRGVRKRAGATSVFTAYAAQPGGAAFDWEAQVRCASWARCLADLGTCVVATNAWTDEVRDLYRGFRQFQVGVRHAVGATGARRGLRAELLAVDEAHAGVFDAAGAEIRAVRA